MKGIFLNLVKLQCPAFGISITLLVELQLVVPCVRYIICRSTKCFYLLCENQTFKITNLWNLCKTKHVHFTCDIIFCTGYLVTLLPDELFSASCTFIMFL